MSRSTIRAVVSIQVFTADHDGAVEIPVSPLTSEINNFYILFFKKVDISLNIGDTGISTAPS